MENAKGSFKRILAICLCATMIVTLVNFTASPEDASAKGKKLTVKSSVKGKVIDVKGSTRLSAKGFANKQLKFYSGNKKVAKVNKVGLVKGVKPGKAKIKVVLKKNKKRAGTITIRVKNLKPAKLNVKEKTLNLKKGQKKALNVKVLPAGVYCPVSFASMKSKIASVDKKGVVVAKTAGKTVIVVKSKEKNSKGKYLTAKVAVNVKGKKSVNKKKPVPTKPKTNEKLADGTWYGTGSDSMYYKSQGPDIVKVVVKNGKVSESFTIKAIADDGYKHSAKILNYTKGIVSVDGLKKQLDDKKGDAYDAVSHATLSAKGQLSAVDNALKRSRKFEKDKVQQPVGYIDFKVRPEAAVTGETLDLSKTVMDVHMNDGTVKAVPFDKLGEYGIKATPNHGSKLPPIGTDFMVYFTNDTSLIKMPISMQVQKDIKWCHATHIMVKFKDGEEKKIELRDSDFAYNLDDSKEVESMKLYRGDKLLKDGELDKDVPGSWKFDIKNVPLPEGYDAWQFETYVVNVKAEQGDAKVESFEIESGKVEKEYGIGDALDLSKIEILAKMTDGTWKFLNGWDACLAAGFSADLENGHIFEEGESGDKKVTISCQGESGTIGQTFNIKVSEEVSQIPAEIELYDGEEHVKTVPVNRAEFKEKEGRLIINKVKLPKKYEKWEEKPFTAKAYNQGGTLLETSTTHGKQIFKVSLKNYKLPGGHEGYVWMSFKFDE